MKRWTLTRKLAVGLGITGSAATSVGGCSQYADEFRAAAGSTFKDGVSTLLDGFVEGVFAVVEPGDGAAAGGSTGA